MSEGPALTSSSRWVRALLEVAHAAGVDLHAWLVAQGFEPSVLGAPRVPFELERAIYRELPKRIPDFAIRAAQGEQLSMFRLALTCCATVGDALDELAALSPAISGGFRIVRTDDDDEVEIAAIQVAPREEVLPAHAELTALRLAELGTIAVRAPHERPIEPLEVWFRHGEGLASAAVLSAFGERARFRERRDAVVFRATDLRRASSEAEPRLAQILRDSIRAELAELPQPTLQQRLHVALAVELSFRVPTAEDVAKHQGLSQRTMIRQLGEEGTSFTKMLQAIRLERAAALLRAEVPATEVSSLVHYSEVPAFWRAFRRYFGRNPGR